MPRPDYDAIVVGAGPAGSVAAFEMARRGRKILLVDRCSFPRYKVCGGCLGHSSMPILDSLGIRDLLLKEGGRVFDKVRLHAHQKSAEVRIPPGISISREVLDQLLIQRAQEAGAIFVPNTVAKLESQDTDFCRMNIRRVDTRRSGDSISGSVLLVADGLRGEFLRDFSSFRSISKPYSRIGLGLRVDEKPPRIPDDTIQMCVGEPGYVGVARIEGESCNIAAAVDADALKSGTPEDLLGDMLSGAGLTVDLGEEGRIKGTPQLTRKRPSVADHRIFVLGDSAGYVEPFTGEGMTWAMQSALLVAPIAERAIRQWNPLFGILWSERHRSHMVRRQAGCQLISCCLRHSWFTLLAIHLAAVHSSSFSLAARLIHRSGDRRAANT